MAKGKAYRHLRRRIRFEFGRIRKQMGAEQEACLYLLSNSGERLDVIALGRSRGELVVLHLTDSGDHIARAVISHVDTIQLLMQVEKKAEIPRPQFRFVGRRQVRPQPNFRQTPTTRGTTGQ